MICAPILLIPATFGNFLPSSLISIDPINVYADANKNISGIKFLADINKETSTFVGMDGELGALYAPKLFPKARLNILPLGAMPSQMFLELQTKKADFHYSLTHCSAGLPERKSGQARPCNGGGHCQSGGTSFLSAWQRRFEGKYR